MERFVIGAALVVAVLIAAGAYFGRGVSDEHGFRFEVGDRDNPGPLKGTGAPSVLAATVYPAQTLKIRDMVAVLKVIPEERADISLEIANPGALAMPKARVDGTSLVVDGGVDRRVSDCDNGAFRADVRGIGEVTEAQMPVITVRVPRAVDVSVGGAVKTEIGPSASVDVSLTGCGPATIADTAGALEISVAGSGEVKAGSARTASLSVAGSGDMTLGDIAGDVEISVAGSGNVTAASVRGGLDVSIAGSGDVLVNGGALADSDISIAGSGDVTVLADVGKLDVSIMGSGDVAVRGAAAAVDANIMGPGDVRVVSVRGGVQKSVMGPGSVTVGPFTID